MHKLLKIVIVFGISTLSTSVFAMQGLDSYPLTPKGIGPLKIGMTLEEAELATGQKITVDSPAPTENCDTANLQPKGLSILLENGKISRITVASDYNEKKHTYKAANKVSTLEGITIGDSEQKAYKTIIESFVDKSEGKLTIESHTYGSPGDHYLEMKGTVPGSNGNEGYGYMFEIADKKVIIMHAGIYPAVTYIEGCL